MRPRREPKQDRAGAEAERKRRQKQRREAKTTRRQKLAEFRAISVNRKREPDSQKSALLSREHAATECAWWRSPCALKQKQWKRRASSASNAAQWRGWRARLLKARAWATPLSAVHQERAAYNSAPNNKGRLHVKFAPVETFKPFGVYSNTKELSPQLQHFQLLLLHFIWEWHSFAKDFTTKNFRFYVITEWIS